MTHADDPRSVPVDGDRLRKFRHTVNLTQEEAGARSGYTERLIRKLERGGPVQLQTVKDVLETYSLLSEEIRKFPLELILLHRNSKPPEILARNWFDQVFNGRDLDAIDVLMHPEVVLIAEGETRIGRDVIRQRVGAILAGFNPLHIEIENIFTGPDHVVAYWSVTKTHVGEFLGIPPTGKTITLRGSSYAKFANDQIIEGRDHWDVQDLVQKLTGNPSKPV
ncbi:ester cyclase [Blastopirellula marina]|uniref:XRE family transcriptional regulator n=1 Tax=Blastopirellula marina TaxID=124 RepID=A0A2S8G8R6_9BACT|nr:ester cyclase [Blastopirellula marina]PQO40838.1 XRE family transcriptional regulator [Blastopirellula marina]PTL45720.1 XRE family transcriptional regulator [Blastopirellula marina]